MRKLQLILGALILGIGILGMFYTVVQIICWALLIIFKL